MNVKGNWFDKPYYGYNIIPIQCKYIDLDVCYNYAGGFLYEYLITRVADDIREKVSRKLFSDPKSLELQDREASQHVMRVWPLGRLLFYLH